MSDEAKVRELFASSVSRPVDVDGHHFKVDRERAVATILQSARTGARNSKTHRNRWWAGAGAVLAAAAAALIWHAGATLTVQGTELLLSDIRGNVVRREGGDGVALAAVGGATRIPKTGELVTAAGASARLRTADGLSVELFERSRLALPGLGQAPSRSVALLAGSIRCDVPQLAAGQEFAVTTPDATVVVRGTAFSVMVSGMADAARTCVRVERGLVVVQSRDTQSLVGPGQSWGCASPTTAASAISSLPASVPPRVAPIIRSPKPEERSARDSRPEGTLEEQNRLFQAGLAAERAGDKPAARLALERLLSRYPASPLAADARLALARVKPEAAAAP
jgi:FecR protein